MAVKKITLDNGFKAKVETDAMDDMELVEKLAALEDNPLLLPAIITHVLGDEQKRALYDHLRTEAGRVPVAAVNEALQDLFEKLGDDSKN